MERTYGHRDRFAARFGRRRALGAMGTGAAALGLAIAGCGGNGNKQTATGSTAGSAAAGGSSAASAASATATPKQGGALVTYLKSPSSEALETDGLRSNSANSQPLFALFYNRLLRLKMGEGIPSEDRTIEGELAAKWEQPDPLTLTFQLRPGVKFHNKPPVNGREMTADDIKFSLERLLGSQFSYLYFFDSIASVNAVSPQTVTLKLKTPDAALLTHLSMGFTWVMAKEAGKPDDKSPLGLSFKDISSAIGTGPFIADTYEQGVRFLTKRNPAYVEQGLPYLDSVEYQVIGDSSTELAALGSGKVQEATIPLGSVADLRSTSPKLVYKSDLQTGWWGTGMRVDQAPFSDVRVRRAMAMAFDQANISKITEAPQVLVTYGSVPAIVGAAYLPADKLGDDAKWWQTNPAEAKKMLAAAGYADGFSTNYWSSVGNQPTDYPEVFAADMAKIGVNVAIKMQEHATFQATTLLGNYDGLAGYFLQLYDADDFLSTLLPDSSRNVSHVNDPKITDLQAKERSELDTNKRLSILQDLIRYLAGQAYVLPKPQLINTTAQQPFVKGFNPRPGYQPLFNLTWFDK